MKKKTNEKKMKQTKSLSNRSKDAFIKFYIDLTCDYKSTCASCFQQYADLV